MNEETAQAALLGLLKKVRDFGSRSVLLNTARRISQTSNRKWI